MSKAPGTDETEPEQLRKLFVGGLSYDTTDEGLREFYEQFGEIVDCVVMKEPKSRVSRGFGFVTYAKLFMVDEAMANRPHHIDGRKVEPKRAIPREICNKTSANIRKLFIGGLSKLVEKEDLEEYFGKYGKLTDCAVVTSKDTGEKRGFGFVEYDDVDAADKVVLIKNHEVKGRQVEVKKALPREESGGPRGGGGGGGGRGSDRGGRGSGGRGGDRGSDRRSGGRDGRRGGSDRDGPRGGRDDYRGGGGGNWGNNQGGWNGGGGGNFNSPWGNNQNAPQGWGGNNMGGGGGGGNWNSPWGNNQGGPNQFGGSGGGGGGPGGMGMGMGNMGGSGNFNSGFPGGGFSNDNNGPVYQTPSNFNGGGFNSGGGFGNPGGNMGGGGGPMRNSYNSSNRSAPYSSGGGGYGGRN